MKQLKKGRIGLGSGFYGALCLGAAGVVMGGVGGSGDSRSVRLFTSLRTNKQRVTRPKARLVYKP